MADGEGGTGQESGSQTSGAGQESGQQQQGNGQQGGQQQGTGQEPGQQGGGQGGQEFDLASIQDPALKGYLEALSRDVQESRREAATYRTQLRDAQQQVQQFQRQNETDAQRLEREQRERDAETERLRQENRDLKVGTAATAAATKANALNPATVVGLISSKVQLDDQGNPTNVDALITDLKKSDPYLFRRVSGDAGGGSGEQRPSGSMNDMIRGAFGR